MSYEIYYNIIKLYDVPLNLPGRPKKITDVFTSSGADFNAVSKIIKECNLSPLAAACLWSIERCVARSPSMNIEFDGRYTIAEAWAALSDSTHQDNNIHLHRFQKWVLMTASSDWEMFYQRTTEFLKLCKLNKIRFSRGSLYEAVAMRDETARRYEDGSYRDVNKTDLFNIAMSVEFFEKSKLF